MNHSDSAAPTDSSRLASLSPAAPVRVDSPAQPLPLISTMRMMLRPLRSTDREPFIHAVRASRAELDIAIPLHGEGEDDDTMFDRQLELATRAAQHTVAAPWVRFVAVLSDDAIAGGFNINSIRRGLEWQADINWWIATPLKGRGLATEGVAALLAYALADLPDGLGLHKVHAWIRRDNPASARVAEKAGLTREGDENSYISTGGAWALHDLYTKTVSR